MKIGKSFKLYVGILEGIIYSFVYIIQVSDLAIDEGKEAVLKDFMDEIRSSLKQFYCVYYICI